MMRRVFLITSNQMKVFEWHDRTLFSSCEFKSNDKGVADLETFLRSSRRMVSQILVELIEEDFQREKIPHVYGNDRQSLIRRQLNRHYANNKYTHARIIGREKTGRKDDEVLLACIANEEPVDFWLDVLNKYRVPIVGIWSLPMLSTVIIKKLKKEHENILLVSRQMRSTLRESFFHDGKFYLARQIKIDKINDQSRNAVNYLTEGAEQIHKFLTNQRIVPFGKKLNVLTLLPTEHIDAAKKMHGDTSVLTHDFIGLETLFKTYGIKSGDQLEADVLFSFVCACAPILSDHYSRKSDKANFVRFIADRSIFYMSMLGSLFLVMIGAFYQVYSLETKQEIVADELSLMRATNYYNENYANQIYKVDSAFYVQSVVDYYKDLKRHALLSPQNVFSPISSVYSQNQFARISLLRFEWSKLHGSEYDQLQSLLKEKVATVKHPDDQIYEDFEENNGEGAVEQYPVLILHGVVDRNNFTYRETVNLMKIFSEALKMVNNVSSVTILSMPVDVREFSQFSDKNGTDYNSVSEINNLGADEYEIAIIFKSLKQMDASEREATETGAPDA